MEERIKNDYSASDSDWDSGHPYAWRTWLRGNLPYFLVNLSVASKGEDCESVGGWHRWYNINGETSGCYHCEVVRPGQLWKMSVE